MYLSVVRYIQKILFFDLSRAYGEVLLLVKVLAFSLQLY